MYLSSCTILACYKVCVTEKRIYVKSKSKSLSFNDFVINTLPAEMFGGSDFWLETRVISKKMIPHMKPKVVFIGKKIKMVK